MTTSRAAAVAPLAAPISAELRVGLLQEILEDGQLVVLVPGAGQFVTAWLETASNLQVRLEAGDSVLVHIGAGVAVTLGRVGSYASRAPVLELESAQAMTLRCGQSTLQMRSDGRVLLSGEDVLVRAKGTKRIRAGTVSIN